MLWLLLLFSLVSSNPTPYQSTQTEPSWLVPYEFDPLTYHELLLAYPKAQYVVQGENLEFTIRPTAPPGWVTENIHLTYYKPRRSKDIGGQNPYFEEGILPVDGPAKTITIPTTVGSYVSMGPNYDSNGQHVFDQDLDKDEDVIFVNIRIHTEYLNDTRTGHLEYHSASSQQVGFSIMLVHRNLTGLQLPHNADISDPMTTPMGEGKWFGCPYSSSIIFRVNATHISGWNMSSSTWIQSIGTPTTKDLEAVHILSQSNGTSVTITSVVVAEFGQTTSQTLARTMIVTRQLEITSECVLTNVTSVEQFGQHLPLDRNFSVGHSPWSIRDPSHNVTWFTSNGTNNLLFSEQTDVSYYPIPKPYAHLFPKEGRQPQETTSFNDNIINVISDSRFWQATSCTHRAAQSTLYQPYATSNDTLVKTNTLCIRAVGALYATEFLTVFSNCFKQEEQWALPESQCDIEYTPWIPDEGIDFDDMVWLPTYKEKWDILLTRVAGGGGIQVYYCHSRIPNFYCTIGPTLQIETNTHVTTLSTYRFHLSDDGVFYSYNPRTDCQIEQLEIGVLPHIESRVTIIPGPLCLEASISLQMVHSGTDRLYWLLSNSTTIPFTIKSPITLTTNLFQERYLNISQTYTLDVQCTTLCQTELYFGPDLKSQWSGFMMSHSDRLQDLVQHHLDSRFYQVTLNVTDSIGNVKSTTKLMFVRQPKLHHPDPPQVLAHNTFGHNGIPSIYFNPYDPNEFYSRSRVELDKRNSSHADKFTRVNGEFVGSGFTGTWHDLVKPPFTSSKDCFPVVSNEFQVGLRLELESLLAFPVYIDMTALSIGESSPCQFDIFYAKDSEVIYIRWDGVSRKVTESWKTLTGHAGSTYLTMRNGTIVALRDFKELPGEPRTRGTVDYLFNVQHSAMAGTCDINDQGTPTTNGDILYLGVGPTLRMYKQYDNPSPSLVRGLPTTHPDLLHVGDFVVGTTISSIVTSPDNGRLQVIHGVDGSIQTCLHTNDRIDPSCSNLFTLSNYTYPDFRVTGNPHVIDVSKTAHSSRDYHVFALDDYLLHEFVIRDTTVYFPYVYMPDTIATIGTHRFQWYISIPLPGALWVSLPSAILFFDISMDTVILGNTTLLIDTVNLEESFIGTDKPTGVIAYQFQRISGTLPTEIGYKSYLDNEHVTRKFEPYVTFYDCGGPSFPYRLFPDQCDPCPTGFQFPNGPCTNCSSGNYGMMCNMTLSQCNAAQCHGRGVCGEGVNECQCHPNVNVTADPLCSICNYPYDVPDCTSCVTGLFGVSCDQNSTQCKSERCSGRGDCNGQTSGCLCEGNYDPSTNCTTCLGYYDLTTGCTQIDNSSCAAGRCHSHGTCDAGTGCTCDTNYDPSTFCAQCVDGWDLSTGCTRCQPNRFGPDCTQTQPECATERCNGKGICTDPVLELCQCTTPNYDNTTLCSTCINHAILGLDCAVCEPDWFGSQCDQDQTTCQVTRCSDHGNCTGIFDGCSCDAKFSGSPDCSTCSIGLFGPECSVDDVSCSHDRCANGVGNCTGQFSGCTCPPHYDPSSNCTRCLPDRYGPDCTWTHGQCRTQVCHDRGNCTLSTPQPECECDDPDTYGSSSNCSTYASPQACGRLVCSNRGVCATIPPSSSTPCLCNDTWSADYNCSVPQLVSCVTDVCHDHGICNHDQSGCICEKHPDCSPFNSTACQLDKYTPETNCSHRSQWFCTLDMCHGRGDCRGPDALYGCSCHSPDYDPTTNCSQLTPEACGRKYCHGRGICARPGEPCECTVTGMDPVYNCSRYNDTYCSLKHCHGRGTCYDPTSLTDPGCSSCDSPEWDPEDHCDKWTNQYCRQTQCQGGGFCLARLPGGFARECTCLDEICRPDGQCQRLLDPARNCTVPLQGSECDAFFCHGHGECLSHSIGCSCDPGYDPDYGCAYLTPAGCADMFCHGRGTCNMTTNSTCIGCQTGWDIETNCSTLLPKTSDNGDDNSGGGGYTTTFIIIAGVVVGIGIAFFIYTWYTGQHWLQKPRQS